MPQNFRSTPEPDYRLIQPSLRGDKRTQWLYSLINRILQVRVENALVYDIDAVDATALPLLLEQFSAEEFTIPGMSEGQTRQLIWDSISIHKHKGTRWAIQHALGIVGAKASISEWWESSRPGQLHTFRIGFYADENPQVGDPIWHERMLQIVQAAKPVRSALAIGIGGRATAGIGAAISQRLGAVLELPAARLPTSAAGGIVAGASLRSGAWLELPAARLPTGAEAGLRVGASLRSGAWLEL